jgi:hypothetical protein
VERSFAGSGPWKASDELEFMGFEGLIVRNPTGNVGFDIFSLKFRIFFGFDLLQSVISNTKN